LIRQATSCTPEVAGRMFEESGRKPKIAILMILLGIGRETAEFLNQKNGQPIAEIVNMYKDAKSDI
jgi:N-acetylmuramic acid 6-phosphate etherase